MSKKIFLEFFIELDIKNLTKGKRLLKLIENKLGLKIFLKEIYKSDLNEYTVFCYLELNENDPKIIIADTLSLLDKLGKKWIVNKPNFKHSEYWQFKGERTKELGNFSVNGIKSIQFTLTNEVRNREGKLISI